MCNLHYAGGAKALTNLIPTIPASDYFVVVPCMPIPVPGLVIAQVIRSNEEKKIEKKKYIYIQREIYEALAGCSVLRRSRIPAFHALLGPARLRLARDHRGAGIA